MFAYTRHIFVYFISYYKILLLYVKSLLGQRKTGNSFTRTNCHRGLDMFCLSGPARQRFDLTFKNSSPTFHEVCVNFYGFCSPTCSKIVTLFRQERTLVAATERAAAATAAAAASGAVATEVAPVTPRVALQVATKHRQARPSPMPGRVRHQHLRHTRRPKSAKFASPEVTMTRRIAHWCGLALIANPPTSKWSSTPCQSLGR